MRKDWNTYFMDIAFQAATRSTCNRKKVGAVIVRDNTTLATGYNGSIRGTEHCTDECGCLIIDDHCERTVHAETNAIAQAAKHGISINNSILYVTCFPCWRCFKMVANSGINTIYYSEKYRDQSGLNEYIEKVASVINMEMIQIEK